MYGSKTLSTYFPVDFVVGWSWYAGATGRALRQAVNASCPPGCDVSTPGSCVPSSTAWGYVCNKCLPTLQPNSETGSCDCPPGKYASADNTCSSCIAGSYCPGGAYGGQGIPAAYTCNSTAAEGSAALTTVGSRGSSTRACGECAAAPGKLASTTFLDTRRVARTTDHSAESSSSWHHDHSTCIHCTSNDTAMTQSVAVVMAGS